MNSNILDNARACFNTEIASLQRAADLLDNEFIKAVTLLATCHKVIITGVGKSGIIGQKISATLSSTGVTSVFLHPVEALHGDIGMVQSDDVAILISKSGNTEEVVRLIPYLKMHNVQTIAIVGNVHSYIATNSDVVLNASVYKEACPFNLAPTASTTTTLCLGDALAVCLMIERKFTLEEFSKLHPLGQIGKSITLSVKDVMKKETEIPVLSKESTFKDALIVMTQKPMGCLCVVGDNSNLIGIITDGDIRRILQSTENLQQMLTISLDKIMNYHPTIIAPAAPLLEALALMENRQHQINVLPVVENSQLVGLVRIHDVISN